MKLYCLDILAIGMVALVSGGIVIGKATEKEKIDYQEQQILNEGYIKTNYTYDQLLYTDFEECVEYKNRFYCY